LVRFCSVTLGVYDVSMCTAGFDHFTKVSLPTFARGRHYYALQQSVNGFIS